MTLSKVICVLGAALLCSCNKSVSKHGSNPAVGKTFTHDGIQLYYEVYGAGEPLLLVHGNAGSIANFKAQIEHFRTHYEVIAMDSRDHGRSGDSPGKITYEKMAVLRKNSVPAEIALPERSCRLCSQYLLSTDVRNYGDVFRSGCRSQSCGGDLG